MKLCKIAFAAIILVTSIIFSTDQVRAESAPIVVVNGKPVRFADEAPVVQNGRVLVPLRPVIEAMGGTVVWDAKTKSVTAEFGVYQAEFVIDSRYARRSQEDKTSYVIQLDVPAQVRNGRTMLPLRASGEFLNHSVDWDAGNRTARINEAAAGSARVSFPEYSLVGDLLGMLEPELDVFFLTNTIRKKHKAEGVFGLHVPLSKVARMKSQDMADNHYFDHTSPTYGNPFEMMEQFGLEYSMAGENIALGYATPAAVVAGWENSPGHLTNMLNTYEYIGVGFHQGQFKYWTQQFMTE